MHRTTSPAKPFADSEVVEHADRAHESSHALTQAWAGARDERAFADLVARYAPMVRATCRRVLQDAAQAEDATQETFILLARHADRIHSNTGGWLMATARTTSIDLLQQGRARRRREQQVAGEQETATSESAHSEIGTPENLAQLDQAMLSLPEGERGVLIDYFWSGRTQEDIGREAGVSQVAIKKRIDRALGNLRSRMLRLSPAALLLLLAAAAPSAEGAGEAALLARLKTLDLRPDVRTVHPGYWVALAAAVAAAVATVIAFLSVSGPAGRGTPAAPVQAPPPLVAPPPLPVVVQPWSDGWNVSKIGVEKVSADALRLDPGVQKYGHMTRLIGKDGVDLTIVVEKRHCPFFGLAIVPSDGTRPLIPVSIVPNPKSPDAGCWARQPGEHRLSLRLDQGEGGPWVVCTVDGKEGLRQRLPAVPTHAMLVVSSGQVLLTRVNPEPASAF